MARKKLLSAVLIIALIVLAFPIIGPRFIMPLMMRFNPPPADLNLATTRVTDKGLYEVSFTPAIDPIAINQIHSWTLHVKTADGKAVDDATITVGGGMPQHGHGLPTRPEVTQNLGNGDYLVEGLKFQMTGWWEVRYDIVANGQPDGITFNLVLQ